MRAVLVVLLVLAAALLGGCGIGAGDDQAGGVTLNVTRDFGERDLGHAERDSVPGGETVMRLLERSFDVETRYGGGFVQQINGVAGGRLAGRPVDWFYYCLLYTSPSPRDGLLSRMPSSA